MNGLIQEQTMAAMVSSLAGMFPGRFVQRSLPRDPANLKAANLAAGVICLVSAGGGNWANYQNREGELGSMKVKAVGFVKVADKGEAVEIEQAELALLNDLLDWCQVAKPEPLDDVVPGDWQNSQQLEHPFGWVVLDLTVRNV